MKKSRMNKIKLRAPITLLFCVIGLVLFGCEEKDSVGAAKYPSDAVYNPNQPVIIDGFSPEEGGVPTQFFITGSNFGSDTSIIKVTINDMVLPVISSDGEHIYAYLGQEPHYDPNNPDQGLLTVTIGSGDKQQTTSATKRFNYNPQPYISTVAGWKDEDGRTGSIDGKLGGTGLGYAQFGQPNNNEKGDLSWLAFDDEKNLYIVEEWEGKALRMIPHTWDTVQTLFTTTERIRTIEFTKDGSEMYMTYDNGNDQWNGPGTVIFQTKDFFVTPFQKPTPKTLINSFQCNGGALHPEDQTYFYNYFGGGEVYKYIPGKSESLNGKENSDLLFRLRDVKFEFTIQFHPSGEYAYIVIINEGYIMKSKYKDGVLQQPTLFAGNFRNKGFKDGVGTAAKFESPWQGAFIGDDFYVCDKGNHCIRKITKEGVVTTYAGRPQDDGLDDGMLRDARFSHPTGLVYNEEEKCFYVADRHNARIRKIILPKNE